MLPIPSSAAGGPGGGVGVLMFANLRARALRYNKGTAVQCSAFGLAQN